MSTKAFSEQIERARKDLLDFSLRNPLLNYRLLRARGVEPINVDPTSVFDLLVREGKPLTFAPDESASEQGSPYEEDSGDTQLSLLPKTVEVSSRPSRRSPRRGGTRLDTAVSQEQLFRRLLNTYRTYRTIIEEQGVNTLYIALGMVHWYEDDSSDQVRKAPLILIPVTIDRRSVEDEFQISYDEREVGQNVSFIEKVKLDFGIDISSLHETDEEDDTEISVIRYYESVEASIERKNRWAVDKSSVVLGFFQFQKLLMYHDLDYDTWPSGLGPHTNKIMASLLEGRFNDPGPAIGPGSHLDDHLDPKDIHHVLDADSSQAIVIADVNKGRNLVVQGPPGTGKSQTIVNLIAEGVGKGKRMLFVSEKMAALEVVKRRLDNLELGDACLELHSNKTTKRAVLDELRRTLQLGEPRTNGVTEALESLTQSRDQLNRYSAGVNSPIHLTQTSPHTSIGELLQLRERHETSSLPSVDIADIESWSKAQFEQKLRLIKDLQFRLEITGVPRDHTFWGTGLRDLNPLDQRRLEEIIGLSINSTNALKTSCERLANVLRLNKPPRSIDTELLLQVAEHVLENQDLNRLNLESPVWDTQAEDINALIQAVTRLQALHSKYDSVLLPGAWNSDLGSTRRTIAETKDNFLGSNLLRRLLSTEFRRAEQSLKDIWRGGLPRSLSVWKETVEAILEAQQLSATISDSDEVGEEIFSVPLGVRLEEWGGLLSEAARYLALIARIREGKVPTEVRQSLVALSNSTESDILRDAISETGSYLKSFRDAIQDLVTALKTDVAYAFDSPMRLHNLAYPELISILKHWSEQVADIHDIVSLNNAYDEAESEGLTPLVELSTRWPDAPSALADVLSIAWHESIYSRARSAYPELRDFNPMIHQRRIEEFARQDEETLQQNCKRVAHSHWKGLPSQAMGGELAILRREFEKKSRNLPIRQLISKAGRAIQAIKPVFMMSPLSIANYLPPGEIEFDIVVFDEASQVRPADAFGALIRARQAVVVGDSQQLPPTSFFDTLTTSDEDEDDDESLTSDLESILSLFRAQGAPEQSLIWHYRSRHESLIALSNQEFYNNRLEVFSSPDYDRSRTGLRFHYLPDSTYDKGKSRVNRMEAKAVAEAVMEHAKQNPEVSLGVAAFSSSQADAIQNELEVLRRNDISLEEFFTGRPDEPFFVKNLENVQGDERDIILISVGYGRDANGRVSMNFGPLNREGGHRRLNVLITRARRRCHVFTNLRGDDISLESSSSRGVRVLKAFLYYAESGVLRTDTPVPSGRDFGSPFQDAVSRALLNAGYEVHEEVASGGKFVDIAIVDPDKPGRYVLGIECDGAKYHSARWARDRDRLREQVLVGLGWRLHHIWSTAWFRDPQGELRRAVSAIKQAIASEQHSVLTSDIKVTKPVPEIQRDETHGNERKLEMPAYKTATVQQLKKAAPEGNIVKIIREIIRLESPVHISLVERRTLGVIGARANNQQIQEAIARSIELLIKDRRIRKRGSFVWATGVWRPEVRDRSGLPQQERRLEFVAPEELREAIIVTVKSSYTVRRDDALRGAAALMGFKRLSQDMREAISASLGELIKSGALVEYGDSLRAA